VFRAVCQHWLILLFVAAGLLMMVVDDVHLSLSGNYINVIWCCIKRVRFTDIVTVLILCIKVTTVLFTSLTAAIQSFSVQLGHSTVV